MGLHGGRWLRRVRIAAIGIAMAGGLLLPTPGRAQVKVYVDFTSDLHNGAGGAPNGTPDWIDELGKLATLTTVDPFTMMERTGIETAILTQLPTIYAGYDITFTPSVPISSPYDTLYYGKDSTGFGSLGIAPRDPGNIASSQLAEIAPANFFGILDEYTGTTDRSDQLDQIATALAGSGAHEVGHFLGLAHHNAYSDPSIHPGTYAATGGVQNSYIMATGVTGITEADRETVRSIDPWSKAMFDLAGGAAGFIAGDHQKLVATPITLDVSEEAPGVDAGKTLLTAKTMSLSMGDTSGMLLGFVAGNPDDMSPPPDPFFMDIDIWKISLPSAGSLTAEVFSEERFGAAGYNTILELLDSSGTPIAFNDNVKFLADSFGGAPDPIEQFDPLLLNIPILTAGDYYLKLTPVSGVSSPAEGYWLAAGFTTVPEPASATLLLTLAPLALARRRRRSGRV